MKKSLIFFFVFLILPNLLFADDLETIERIIFNVNARIQSGILISDIEDEKDFEIIITRQIEFALINENRKDLLLDEWINLSLYCLARKHKYYKLAKNILQKEYDIENYKILRRWIKKRIDLLNSLNFSEYEFDIKREILDLRSILRLD